MGEHNSPMFTLGMEHGLDDASRIGSCPPQGAMGPRYPEGHPYNMYQRGYWRIMEYAAPHVCTDRCEWRQREIREQQERERREAQKAQRELAG